MDDTAAPTIPLVPALFVFGLLVVALIAMFLTWLVGQPRVVSGLAVANDDRTVVVVAVRGGGQDLAFSIGGAFWRDFGGTWSTDGGPAICVSTDPQTPTPVTVSVVDVEAPGFASPNRALWIACELE